MTFVQAMREMHRIDFQETESTHRKERDQLSAGGAVEEKTQIKEYLKEEKTRKKEQKVQLERELKSAHASSASKKQMKEELKRHFLVRVCALRPASANISLLPSSIVPVVTGSSSHRPAERV